MSTNKEILSRFRRFMRSYGISQHAVAVRFDVSQPTMSKVLSGNAAMISSTKMDLIANMMQDLMDSVESKEHELYVSLMPLCEDADRSVLINVFKSILRDIGG